MRCQHARHATQCQRCASLTLLLPRDRCCSYRCRLRPLPPSLLPAAASKAEVLEASVATTKDQLLRLTADFENFRKRMVSAAAAAIRRS